MNWRNVLTGKVVCSETRPFGEDWYGITEKEYRMFSHPLCACFEKQGDNEDCPIHGDESPKKKARE